MDIRPGKGIVSVVVLTRDEKGSRTSKKLYSRKQGKKKKGTRVLRPLECAARQIGKATAAFADSYTARHDASNRKGADGWLRDFPYNVFRATRVGSKKLRSLSPLEWS